jgi:hypothetical protein
MVPQHALVFLPAETFWSNFLIRPPRRGLRGKVAIRRMFADKWQRRHSGFAADNSSGDASDLKDVLDEVKFIVVASIGWLRLWSRWTLATFALPPHRKSEAPSARHFWINRVIPGCSIANGYRLIVSDAGIGREQPRRRTSAVSDSASSRSTTSLNRRVLSSQE